MNLRNASLCPDRRVRGFTRTPLALAVGRFRDTGRLPSCSMSPSGLCDASPVRSLAFSRSAPLARASAKRGKVGTAQLSRFRLRLLWHCEFPPVQRADWLKLYASHRYICLFQLVDAGLFARGVSLSNAQKHREHGSSLETRWK